jgi:hypothetical protein
MADPKTVTDLIIPLEVVNERGGADLIGPALEALLTPARGDSAFATVFDALHETVGFDQALALEETGAGLRCIAAQPDGPVGLRFAMTPFLARAMTGHEPHTKIGGELEVVDGACHPLPAIQQALGLPMRARNRRGVLVLVRAEGNEPFSKSQIATTQQLGPLCSAALALHDVERVEIEIEQLRPLVDDLRHSEARAVQNLDVLWAVFDAMPVSLTLKDNDGRVILANCSASNADGWIVPAVPSEEHWTGIAPASSATSEDSASAESTAKLLTEEHVDGPAGEAYAVDLPQYHTRQRPSAAALHLGRHYGAQGDRAAAHPACLSG